MDIFNVGDIYNYDDGEKIIPGRVKYINEIPYTITIELEYPDREGNLIIGVFLPNIK